MIREAKLRDAEGIAKIYNYYIDKTFITFEEEVISSEEMKLRISEIKSINLPWLIAEENNIVVGFAYASKWKGRCAYRFSVETTVYLLPHATSKGLGTVLYKELFSRLREISIHSAIAGISLPNPTSVALHEKFGMEEVAHLKKLVLNLANGLMLVIGR